MGSEVKIIEGQLISMKGRPRCRAALPVVALSFFLLVTLPLFLNLPTCLDVAQYDLCARTVLRGGMLYRDTFEVNLPGIVWLHLLLRPLLGWDRLAIRAADLAFFAISVGLLLSCLRRLDLDRVALAWSGFALAAYYLSTSDWCHCQRDSWMLVPALGALNLRVIRVERSLAGDSSHLGLALAEGLLWGAAFWIKPYVAFPALAVWLSSAAFLLGQSVGLRRVLRGELAVLLGGLAVGGLGIAWLLATGTWAAFWDLFLSWNPDYVALGRTRSWLRPILFLQYHAPWGAAHLVAVPIAIGSCAPLFRVRLGGLPESPSVAVTQSLLSSCYLGWLCQAVFVQHDHEYIVVPPTLLALTIVAGWFNRLSIGKIGLAAVGVFAVLAAYHHPLLQPARLALWPSCWTDPGSAALADALAVDRDAGRSRSLLDMEQLAEYFRRQGVRDGELTCYSCTTADLYLMCGVQPSTRFTAYTLFVQWFPRHRNELLDTLNASRQRYVATDLRCFNQTVLAEAEREIPSPYELPSSFPEEWRGVFPWSEPIVFRSGPFAVHRVTGPVARLTP
jgi:hypothetical protein